MTSLSGLAAEIGAVAIYATVAFGASWFAVSTLLAIATLPALGVAAAVHSWWPSVRPVAPRLPAPVASTVEPCCSPKNSLDRARSGLRSPRAGTRDNLNACLAGLLIAKLQLDDRPESLLLSAAAEVVADAGPKPKAVLSAMSRGLERRVGMGTWNAVVAGLVDAGVVAPSSGGLRPGHQVVDRVGRDAIVARLRVAASADDPMAVRTAVLLSMVGPAHLLELVAPDRSAREARPPTHRSSARCHVAGADLRVRAQGSCRGRGRSRHQRRRHGRGHHQHLTKSAGGHR